MPSETTSQNATSTGEQVQSEHAQQVADLTERLTETKRATDDKRNRAERLRVQIERTKVGYAEGIPAHLLRGTEPDEIRRYATKLKQWRG